MVVIMSAYSQCLFGCKDAQSVIPAIHDVGADNTGDSAAPNNPPMSKNQMKRMAKLQR
jgi:hypothetical protein